jgi:hypothetical protein
MREIKDFKFSLGNDVDDEGKFDGFASVFGGLDSYGDTVERGAFKKTLKENKSFPLLWSHDTREPIGIIGGEESDKGLAVIGELNLEVQSAREKRSLAKQGAVRGLSIGYEAVKWSYDQTEKVRHLKEIKLWEISLVVFPADGNARIGSVKGQGGDLGELLEQILAMDLREIDIKHRDAAAMAVDRIQALLKGMESLTGTPPSTQPPEESGMPPEFGHLLGRLDAEIKGFRATVDQINNPRR